MSLSALIEALTIFRKYGDPPYPTHCEHDELFIVGIEPSAVSDEDRDRLRELHFTVSSEGGFHSYYYGSA